MSSFNLNKITPPPCARRRRRPCHKLAQIVLIISLAVLVLCQTSSSLADNTHASASSSSSSSTSLESHSPPPSYSSLIPFMMSLSSMGDNSYDSTININQIIANLSLFSDESSEIDTMTVTLLENVTHACLQRCIGEESLFINDFGIKCLVGDSRPECYRSRCFKGCELWWHALKEFEPCQEACSSTQFYPYDLPCISACETTQRQYWHLQRLHVQQLLLATNTTTTTSTTTTATTAAIQPQLLHDNETLNTLTLKWPITTKAVLPAPYLASRPFNIQYQYVLSASASTVNDTLDMNRRQQSKQQANANLGDRQSTEQDEDEERQQEQQQQQKQQQQQQEQWWNLADYYCNENFECDIMDGLMPYTSYKFRFELPFGDNVDDILYSLPSEIYTTPAMGRPISKPIIRQTLALDDSHLAVFWQPGKFINGPLTNFKIKLLHEESHLKIEKLLPPDSSYIIFPHLLPSTLYTLELSMLNQEGEGPLEQINITTKSAQKSALKLDDLNSLLILGEYSIILKSLDPLVESKVIFKSEEILKDFDIHQYTKHLFLVDHKGAIFSLFLDNPINYTVLNVNVEDFRPSKLAVDWLNQRLFMAGETSLKTWQISSMDFNGSSLQTIAKDLNHSLTNLQIDPINGWLFSTDTKGQLTRINLDSLKREIVETPFEIQHFSNDFETYLLKVFNNGDRKLHELSYDGRFTEKLEHELSPTIQGDLLSFQYLENNVVVANNGSHLLRQSFEFNELEITALKEVELCLKVVPLLSGVNVKGLQPLAKPGAILENLQAVLSANKAKITWLPPVRIEQFQSKSAWQQWEYELEILDVASSNAFNIRSIKSTYFQVERLQANNLYKIKVRAMFAGVSRIAIASTTSEWSQELIARTWPMGNHLFLWATEQGLWQSEEMFNETKLKALTQQNIKSFSQVNASLFYANQEKRDLGCLNLMNPEVSCGFRASHVYSVAYDWRGGKLYWSDTQRNCLVRADLKGGEMELLPIFEAKSIKLDPLKGFVYFNTDSRLVRRKLNGGLNGPDLEYYHVNGNGESLVGFALDLSSHLIYWLVQHQEGLTKLYRADVDAAQPENIKQFSLSYQIQPDSFNYLAEIESFIWLKAWPKQAVLVSQENLKQLTEFSLALKGNVNFIDMRLDYLPYKDLAVVLEAVDKDSIHITEGFWDDFNIKWSPLENKDNLTIVYRVFIRSLKDPQHFLTFEVEQPLVRITEFKLVGHLINVTITPSTVWSLGLSVSKELRTPAAAPKQPKNLRVFVEQTMEPLQNQSNISALVRWDSPDNISNEKEVFYKVFCWLKEELHSVEDIEDMGLKTHEVRFYNLLKEETYMFQVQAFSLSRAQGGEKSSLLTHFINPDIQSIPKLIFTTSEFIGELDLDLNKTKIWVHTSSEVEHLAMINGEQRLLWVNENVELMSYQPGAAALKLARMRAEVLALTVDWVLRRVYWAELSGDVENAVDVYELDLNQYEGKVMLGSKLFSLNQGKLLKNLILLPYSQMLVWLEYDMGSQNSTLQGRNLTDLSELKFKNHLPFISLFEGSLLPEMESLNLLDFKGKLTAFELQRQLSTVLKIPYNPLDGFQSFERDSGFIYTLTNHTLQAFNRRKNNMEFSQVVPEIKLMKAFNFQEYPQRECLILDHIPDLYNETSLAELFVQEVGETYLVIQLRAKNPFENCHLPIPGLKYQLNIKGPQGYVKNLLREPGPLNITDLKPFSNYSLEIKSSSYYQQKFLINEMLYPLFFTRTHEGYPSKPLNFSVKPLSPAEILVSWAEPEALNAESVTYQLSWQLPNSSLISHKIVEGFEINLINLEPSQEYQIWLEVFTKPSKQNRTEKVVVTTYPEPDALILLEQQAYNLTLQWLPNALYDSIILECRPISQDPDLTAFSIDITGLADNITITNLQPKTQYEFYFKLYFNSVSQPYTWPEQQNAHFVFETLADAPGRPGQPQIEHITGEIFKVFWESAPHNGASIVEYSLEALQARQPRRKKRQTPNNLNTTSSISLLSQLPWVEELQPIEDKWLVYCNTSELSCIVRELHTMRLFMFRVRARNDLYGWGPYSEESERVLEPFVSPQKRNSLVLAIIAPAMIVTTCVIILFVIRKIHQRRLKAKQLLAKSRPSIWSNFSTLQQQQLASRNRAFSLTSASTMYTGGPLSDADIALLPHINWSQITLLNFLGSGAFGEVYEGMMKHEDQEEPEKVAIKSLRKGASEFAELLKEAQLMSNFKHDNIVRLIGVCCDTESISIIMEHMEGGDLLSYLRESRPNSTKPVAALQLLDLMSMCIDIATGMAYLEDMHFVHRDLACRNCLVSSRIPSKRMVKIGDFGLARDIYKNDYYRKEGEALMPVRWMAPESLVDGVFTTQTDVWAFGVLCWEILTLGQQPYAARNNFEVLNFVKEGGRLEQPDNCPDKLFSLMLECWHTEPEERPSFRKCFNSLLAIKTDVRRVSLGYNIDDSDYATYANQHGILFSTFLASNTLNTTKEEQEGEEEEGDKEEDAAIQIKEIKQNSLNAKNEEATQWSGKLISRRESLSDRNDLKVRFNSNISMKDIDGDSLNDQSQLIDAKLYRIQENPDYYINEGISRL